jgi:hypothetical protein
MPKIKSKAKNDGFQVNIAQIRVLKALAGGGSLSRSKLRDRAGFSPISGTITCALNGIRVGSSTGKSRPGLVDQGLVTKTDLDIDGLTETVYRITELGKQLLVNRGYANKELPPLRDAAGSTNHRYNGTDSTE